MSISCSTVRKASPPQNKAQPTCCSPPPRNNRPNKAGLMVFGTDAGIELSLTPIALQTNTIQTVVGADRTDSAGAIRLGTAAFPETGQKRLVLFSDGNENLATPCRR